MEIDLNNIQRVYFIGAGGIGMAALERYFLARGKRVAGYDHTPTELTAELQAEGVDITFDDSPDAILDEFRNPEGTLLVYTPAVPQSHPGFTWLREHGHTPHKRSEVLGAVTRHTDAICFSGTHGKTTTSSMAAHLLEVAGIGSNAFLGGELRNYNSNLLLSDSSPYSVVEADEYDRSFHRLTPYVAVVTATDPDHLDIYGTEEQYLEGFAHFTSLIRPDGALLMHTGLKLKPRVQQGVRIYTYGANDPSADYHAAYIRRGDGSISFDFVGPGIRINSISLGVPVEVNIDNAVAAIAACHIATRRQLTPEAARSAMSSFLGAKRRFEFYVKSPQAVVIDDYAHHPGEIAASIASVRALYPTRRLTVAFQPHLYTRTRDFAPEFAHALSAADSVVLCDIYPAREEPIPGVTSDIIFSQLTVDDRHLTTRANLPATLNLLNPDLLLVLGAGNIVECLPQIVADTCARHNIQPLQR